MRKRSDSVSFKLAVVVGVASVVLGGLCVGRRAGSVVAPDAAAPDAGDASPTLDGSLTASLAPSELPEASTAVPGGSARFHAHDSPEMVAYDRALVAGDLAKVQELVVDRGVLAAGGLGRAASSGNVALVRWLLDHGCDAREDDDSGIPPLATGDAFPEVVKLLLARGAREPSIFIAVREGAVNAVRRSLARDRSRANALDDGRPVLITAITEAPAGANLAIVRMLLDAGARLDAVGEPSLALEAAVLDLREPADDRALDIVKLLVARGAVVSVNVARSHRPARTEERAAFYDVLLSGKLAPDATYEMVTHERDPKLIARIGAKGVRWNGEHPTSDVQALVSAASELDDARVDALLAIGAPVDRADALGMTALLSAIDATKRDSAKAAAIVTALLAKRADPNKPNPRGVRPLYLAAKLGNEPVVKALLAAGANVNDVYDGSTALDAAEVYEHPGVTALILARGGTRRLVRRDQ